MMISTEFCEDRVSGFSVVLLTNQQTNKQGEKFNVLGGSNSFTSRSAYDLFLSNHDSLFCQTVQANDV